MKTVFNAILLSLTLLAAPALASPEGAQRAAAVLDYIAADYGGAVADGAIVDRFEFDEQIEFVGTARKLLEGLAPPPEVTDGLDRLEAAMQALRPAPEVTALARETRRALLAHYGVVQSPAQPPDAARGARLYAEACAYCHGADGSGDTPVAAAFEVKPPDFRDPEGARTRSPFRAYNTVTFGVEGTPMPGFGQLSDAERWDLAFYVTTLAHGGPRPEAAAGEALDLATLAAESDEELLARLGEVPEADRPARLASLRATAPYRARAAGDAGRLAVVRRHLDRVEQALAAGDASAARLAALDAYLEGFEPLEARVAALDSDLLFEAEMAFGRLRTAIELGTGAEEALAETRAMVERVEARLAQGIASAAALFVASAVILLREGLEVVLLVGVLLTLLGRLGRDDAKRWVHRGWAAALVAGVGTWFAAAYLVEVSGRSRELLEGVVALVAAAVLFFVSHWFLSAAEKQRWLAFLKSKVATHLGSGRVLPLFGLAFLAVYREAFETVLFYQALLLESPGGAGPVLAGMGAGALGVAVFGYLVLRAGRKLPIGPLFTASGLVLCALCVVFVGQGLAALREAGALSPRPLDLPAVPWLGLYPDALGLALQGATVALIAGLVLVPRRRNRGATAAP